MGFWEKFFRRGNPKGGGVETNGVETSGIAIERTPVGVKVEFIPENEIVEEIEGELKQITGSGIDEPPNVVEYEKNTPEPTGLQDFSGVIGEVLKRPPQGDTPGPTRLEEGIGDTLSLRRKGFREGRDKYSQNEEDWEHGETTLIKQSPKLEEFDVISQTEQSSVETQEKIKEYLGNLPKLLQELGLEVNPNFLKEVAKAQKEDPMFLKDLERLLSEFNRIKGVYLKNLEFLKNNQEILNYDNKLKLSIKLGIYDESFKNFQNVLNNFLSLNIEKTGIPQLSLNQYYKLFLSPSFNNLMASFYGLTDLGELIKQQEQPNELLKESEDSTKGLETLSEDNIVDEEVLEVSDEDIIDVEEQEDFENLDKEKKEFIETLESFVGVYEALNNFEKILGINLGSNINNKVENRLSDLKQTLDQFKRSFEAIDKNFLESQIWILKGFLETFSGTVYNYLLSNKDTFSYKEEEVSKIREYFKSLKLLVNSEENFSNNDFIEIKRIIDGFNKIIQEKEISQIKSKRLVDLYSILIINYNNIIKENRFDDNEIIKYNEIIEDRTIFIETQLELLNDAIKDKNIDFEILQRSKRFFMVFLFDYLDKVLDFLKGKLKSDDIKKVEMYNKNFKEKLKNSFDIISLESVTDIKNYLDGLNKIVNYVKSNNANNLKMAA